MKLRIEQWVENTNPFNELGEELFEEAVKNYKFASYKSSFIMSYLAFKVTIRDRILDCPYGEQVTKNAQFWEKAILEPLKNDDSWEKHLNSIVEASCTVITNRKPIGILNFENGDSIKTEYNYWKNKRNVCAHAKSEIIDNATVESFWNYLMDNLSRFYVMGGEEYLVEELFDIYKYYEYLGNSESERINKALYDISVVFNGNIKEYFCKFFKKAQSKYKIINKKNKEFWEFIIYSENENIREGIIEYILEDKYIFFAFYSYFPQLLEYAVSNDKKFVIDKLSLWLESCPEVLPTGSENIFWDLLIEALDKFGEQVNLDKIINKETIDLIPILTKEHDIELLNEYDIFKKYILEVSRWFFQTDSSSQYNNFIRYNNNFTNIERCFSFLRWDKQCLEELNSAMESLEKSTKLRENHGSLCNAYDYNNCYKKIVIKNEHNIKNSGIDLTRYTFILNIINN